MVAKFKRKISPIDIPFAMTKAELLVEVDWNIWDNEQDVNESLHDYNHLHMNAFAMISDTGMLPEESSFFTSVGYPFPAVCISTSTQRQKCWKRCALFSLALMKRTYFKL